jgi:hypothetical protein
MEASALAPAVLAVIGDAGAFAALRAGRLAEIPEGGGLDFLTAAPPASSTALPVATRDQPHEPLDAELATTARAQLQQAEALLMDARERSRTAQRALEDAQNRLESAEQQLRRAQDDVATRRTEVERTRRDAQTAAAQALDAERAVVQARTRSKAV